jgi:hypothetical protein
MVGIFDCLSFIIMAILCYICIYLYLNKLNIVTSKRKLALLVLLSVMVYYFNFMLLVKENQDIPLVFNGIFILLLYYNIILYAQYKIFIKSIISYQVLILLQTTFIINHFTSIGIHALFCTTDYNYLRVLEYVIRVKALL